MKRIRKCPCLVEEGQGAMHDAEVLDELITSRGEFKVRSVSYSEERHGQIYPEGTINQNE